LGNGGGRRFSFSYNLKNSKATVFHQSYRKNQGYEVKEAKEALQNRGYKAKQKKKNCNKITSTQERIGVRGRKKGYPGAMEDVSLRIR